MCNVKSTKVESELDEVLDIYRRGVGVVFGETVSVIDMAEGVHEAREILTRRGYEFIDGGTTRDVFIMPCREHVVKLQPGGSSNSREIEMSRRNLPGLAPVLNYSICNGWLVMPYFDKVMLIGSCEEDLEYIDNRLADNGWSVVDTREIGYLDGDPYLIDYGAPWKKI